ncbi:MAG TPA: hypothetical protein VI197_20990 [Polyangiaceae bacterium]
MRRYAIDLVERQGQPVREALRIFSRVFDYCMHDSNATRAAGLGHDPFDAVDTDHAVLPANYRQKCLPHWRTQLLRQRAREAAGG